MNEFAEMLKEAMVGEEPFESEPGREVLLESIRKFERRVKTVRTMAWIGSAFLFGAALWAFVSILRAPEDAGVRTYVTYLAVFIWGMTGVGMMKMWFAMMLNDIGLRKEIKRLQMMMLEARPAG
jgi:hypothetical protein